MAAEKSPAVDPIRRREVILFRKDVASQHWHKTWSEAVALAEAGEDGVTLSDQVLSKEGTPLTHWTERINGVDTARQVAPKGWAAFYQQAGIDRCWLHVQNY